uniref:Uncharacterized protein n=1 Tax=Salmonella sp. TaxID=599 RepID=A0A482EXF9_SALSP|nr:hypothetical protein NNIBIDOC_00229 [Salmonella sp.]
MLQIVFSVNFGQISINYHLQSYILKNELSSGCFCIICQYGTNASGLAFKQCRNPCWIWPMSLSAFWIERRGGFPAPQWTHRFVFFQRPGVKFTFFIIAS